MTKTDTDRHAGHRLSSGGFLWGSRRTALGLSLRDLEDATGIYRGFLSRMENGVMIPTGEEFDKVMRVLEARAAGTLGADAPASAQPLGSAMT